MKTVILLSALMFSASSQAGVCKDFATGLAANVFAYSHPDLEASEIKKDVALEINGTFNSTWRVVYFTGTREQKDWSVAYDVSVYTDANLAECGLDKIVSFNPDLE